MAVTMMKKQKITKLEMEKKFKLLETIANNIISEIFLKYPQINTAEVSVSKFNPQDAFWYWYWYGP